VKLREVLVLAALAPATAVWAVLVYKGMLRGFNSSRLERLEGRHVYDQKADAERLLAQALVRARAHKQRVLVVLGGDWCKWCVTLDSSMAKNPALNQLTTERFVLLKLDADAASDLDERWGNPSELSVPVVVLLNPDGTKVHVQNMVPFQTWGGRLLAYDAERIHQALEPWAL
jgi:thiol:disulfide interchange protein